PIHLALNAESRNVVSAKAARPSGAGSATGPATTDLSSVTVEVDRSLKGSSCRGSSPLGSAARAIARDGGRKGTGVLARMTGHRRSDAGFGPWVAQGRPAKARGPP